jgi:choline dehydrogenase-like flavoprotein
MDRKDDKKEYDVIVVGSGAGGSTVAREMAIRKKKVLLLEQGGRCEFLGNPLSLPLMMKNFGVTLTREHYFVAYAKNYGGA